MKYRFLTIIFFVLALFPYITFWHTSFDLQPWALLLGVILSVLFFVKEHKTIPQPLQIVGAITLYAGVIFAVLLLKHQASLFDGTRSMVDYISLFIFTYVGFYTFKTVPEKVYIIAIIVWLLGAAAQLYYGPHILAPFLSRLSTDSSRGMTSFASEPAFYASFAVTMMILNELFYLEKKYNWKLYCLIALLLILQITFAAAGVGLVVLILFAVGKIITLFFKSQNSDDRLGSLIIIILIALSLGFQRYDSFKNYITIHPIPHITIRSHNSQQQAGTTGSSSPSEAIQSRSSYILQSSVDNPAAFIQNDNSIKLRLFNPIPAVYGGLIYTKGFGIGLGVSSTQIVLPQPIGKLFNNGTIFNDRIQGGFVTAIYELGVVGIVFIATIAWILIKSLYKNSYMRSFTLLSIMTVFLPAFIFGSFAFPLLGYILGIHLYYLKNTS
jgi:hypothetical protein